MFDGHLPLKVLQCMRWVSEGLGPLHAVQLRQRSVAAWHSCRGGALQSHPLRVAVRCSQHHAALRIPTPLQAHLLQPLLIPTRHSLARMSASTQAWWPLALLRFVLSRPPGRKGPVHIINPAVLPCR